VCSANIRAKRAERVARAIEAGGGAAEWTMLTVTLRHHNGLALKDSLSGLMLAWRRTRQGGRIQRIWKQRVSASIRGVEVTHGENGWHPHVHVLVRTSSWQPHEREALLTRWKQQVLRVLGKDCLPNEHGLHWSDERGGNVASYLAKLGLEVAGIGKSETRLPGSRSHWHVADDAAGGDILSERLWSEFRDATKGRRMLELDDRAALLAPEESPGDGEDCESDHFDVSRDDLRAFAREERVRPSIFAIVLAAAEERGGAGIREWAAFCRQRHGPGLARSAPPREAIRYAQPQQRHASSA
jgi:hypothetical protein